MKHPTLSSTVFASGYGILGVGFTLLWAFEYEENADRMQKNAGTVAVVHRYD